MESRKKAEEGEKRVKGRRKMTEQRIDNTNNKEEFRVLGSLKARERKQDEGNKREKGRRKITETRETNAKRPRVRGRGD